MKRQPKRIAAFFAVLLALCGIYQTAWAQPTEAAVIRTYHVYNETLGLTIVLRLKQLDEISEVYGAMTRSPPDAPLAYEIKGGFDPNTGKLTAKFDDAPARQPGFITNGTVDGTYDSRADTFSLVFSYQIGGDEPQSLQIDNIRGHTEPVPFLVGIWQYFAADTPAALVSAPQFAGEFYILRQFPAANNTFRGIFSGKPPGDVGEIEGRVAPEGVVFKRTGTSNNLPFEQTWFGQVTNNTESIQGAIESTQGSAWKGEFIARSFPSQ